ncbi:MAG: hypothetical protein ACYDDU_22055 [Dermatophilaceae bacterium]
MTLILADSNHERRFTRQRLTGGWLKISVRVLASGPHSRHSNLRVLLVADVLRRVVEDLHAGHVQLAMVLPSAAGEPDDRLRMALPFGPETFGIRPSLGVGDFLDPAAELLGRGCDVIVEPSTDAPVSTPPHFGQSDPPLALRVGEVTGPVRAQGREPLATRLALLRHRRGVPVSLAPDTLDQAEETLRKWRSSVAAWAEHPSAPMHRATVDSARAALDDNLDVGTVLGLLHQLIENPAVPPGSKFETFVFLDRVLALDLARDLGQPLSKG